MALKVPDVGELVLLAALQTPFNTYVLHLYVNNYTPDDSSVAGNFTEASFPGYASITLNTWGTPFTNGSNKGEIDETDRVFTRTAGAGSQDVYGYYITTGPGVLGWAERNPSGPVTIATTGDIYAVLPRFTLNSEF